MVRDKKNISEKINLILLKRIGSTPIDIEYGNLKIRKFLKWETEGNFIENLNKTFDWYYENYNFFKAFSKNKFFKRLGLKL